MLELNDITGRIVDTAIKVHIGLGPGLLESVYAAVLTAQLRRGGLTVDGQVQLPFEFDGMKFDRGLIVDLLVERQVVVELKSIEKLAPVHSKQVLSYLRLLDLRIGLLMNFGQRRLVDGLVRIVNDYKVSSAPSASSV